VVHCVRRWLQENPSWLLILDNVDTPVAQAWNQTLAHLSLPAQALLRLLAHLAPEPIANALVEAGADALREAVALLAEETAAPAPDPAADPQAALTELRRYSLIKRDGPSFTVHRMVQEVVLSRIPAASAGDWVEAGVRWIERYAPVDADDVRTWPVWDPLRPHVERLLELTEAHNCAASASGLMNELGLLLLGKALYHQAEPLQRRALAMDEAAFGPQHPGVAMDLNNLAALLHLAERPEEAEPLMKRAVEILETSLGDEHPRTQTVRENLAKLEAELAAIKKLAVGAQLGPSKEPEE
jgi:tetratricopeptide (TPR) repeat protein